MELDQAASGREFNFVTGLRIAGGLEQVLGPLLLFADRENCNPTKCKVGLHGGEN